MPTGRGNARRCEGRTQRHRMSSSSSEDRSDGCDVDTSNGARAHFACGATGSCSSAAANGAKGSTAVDMNLSSTTSADSEGEGVECLRKRRSQ